MTVQQSKTKKNEQKAKEIRSSIQVRQSETQKEITQIRGGGAGAAKLIQANAAAESAKLVIAATADAYGQLREECGFTPANKLDEFIYLSDLQTADNINVMYNVERAIVDLSKA